MTTGFLITKKDPRNTDFILVHDSAHMDALADAGGGIPAKTLAYTADTILHNRPHYGARATTTVTRTDPAGGCMQVGIIEWPIRPHDPVQLFVGTRSVEMTKSGLYTSPERFMAADGFVYEWQIYDGRSQLVPVRASSPTSNSYIATFVQSETGFFRRKVTSSLFISPEGSEIFDDIIVTFIYFECKWRDKENLKSRSGLSGGFMA